MVWTARWKNNKKKSKTRISQIPEKQNMRHYYHPAAHLNPCSSTIRKMPPSFSCNQGFLKKIIHLYKQTGFHFPCSDWQSEAPVKAVAFRLSPACKHSGKWPVRFLDEAMVVSQPEQWSWCFDSYCYRGWLSHVDLAKNTSAQWPSYWGLWKRPVNSFGSGGYCSWASCTFAVTCCQALVYSLVWSGGIWRRL